MAADLSLVEADDLVRDVAIAFDSASLQRRIAALKLLVGWLSSATPCQPLAKPQTRVLARLLLRALCSPQYLERVWIKGLYEAIASAINSERCPSFPSIAVVNLAGVASSAGDIAGQMAVVRITLVLILAAVPKDVSASMPDWIGKLIVLQACVLERMALWGKDAALSKAAKIIVGGLRSRPHLLEVYLDVLAAEDKSGDYVVALGVVTEYCHAVPSYHDGGYKARLLDVYIRDALLTKGGCTERYKLASFAPLLNSLTEHDFSTVLLPVLEKLQKKNPDSVLSAVAFFMEQVSIDLSGYLRSVFLPPLLRQLRSSKELVRCLAVELTGNLAKRCGDPEALGALVSELSAVLAGKSGVLAQWYQRQSLVMGLERVRAGIASAEVPSPNSAEVATRVIESLLPVVEKESHEDTRYVALGCLARWGAMLNVIPPKLLQYLKSGLGATPKATATACAAAVCQLSDGSHVCAQLAPLLPELLSRVDVAAQKSAVFHPDAIYCAKAILEIAAADTACADQINEKFPWHALANKASFLFPAGILRPYSADVQLVGNAAGPLAPHTCTALCRVVLLGAKRIVAASSQPGNSWSVPSNPVSSASCLALMQCAVLPNVEVRQAALAAAVVLRDDVSDVQVLLLKACKQVVEETSQAQATLSPAKDDGRIMSAPPNRFATTLCCVLGDSALGTTFAAALLLAHHPVVCHSSKGAQSLWKGILKRAFGGVEGITRLLREEDVTMDVTTSILNALQAQASSDRLSGQGALASLGSSCGQCGVQIVAEGLFPALLNVLEEGELRSLSVTDVDVFFTPANVLHTSPTSQRKSVATVSKNASRRGKDAEEAEWEERVRAELGAKGKTASVTKRGKEGEDGANQEAVNRLLAEEKIVRRKVGDIRNRAIAALTGLTSGFRTCPKVGFVCIPSALPVLLPLLGWKLLEPAVHECVQSAALTALEESPGCASQVASALRSIQVQPSTAGRSSVVNECLQCVAQVCLPDSANEKVLEDNALALVFPVVQAVLNNPPSMPQCSLALRIVSIHSNMEQYGQNERTVHRGLRRSMIEAVLNVVDKFPQAEPSPEAVLASICTAPAMNTSEWSPVLGGSGLLSEAPHVRLACLESVMMMVLDGQSLTGDPLVESRLWLSKFEPEQENAELACEVWDARGLPLSPTFAVPLMVLLSDRKSHVRDTTARALAGGLKEHPESCNTLLKRLYDLYNASKPLAPEKDDAKLDMDKFFAAPMGAEPTSSARVDDGWPTRAGVASTIRAVGEARAFNEGDTGDDVQEAFSFLVKDGLADTNVRVRGQMLAAGIAIITAYGEDKVIRFIRPCEAVMAENSRRGEDSRSYDWRREGVVVFMGSAAKHLDKEDPKVLSIVQTLIGALATPSEAVQIAVSDCLAPLMKTPVVKEQGPALLKGLISRCVGGKSYGERRGAAFGVAAVVKGLGISAIKKHEVISSLEAACKSSSFQAKQGALCAFECMCVRLGLLFEPYVIVILPHLLKCFGDSSNYVREAAHDCARAIMSKLSAHGVKLILPAILKSLSDPAWRTKQGAIELLGSMAYCAPRQLADSLPMIVPKLTDAFADTHPKVRDSGRKALEDIGSVIRNPEVASLSMTLMSALSDPSKFTRGALEALLACEFMHSIDAPSLALMVPVLQRGLKDRSAEVKRKAALITGNTCSMISESKDLLPYLSAIVPGLKSTCVDPIPDVRATAAKALAALVRGMGEDKVGDLVPWLIETLKADSSSSERSGGAQALSEVLVVTGAARAKAVLGDLLPLAAHPKGAVREGVLWVLCFLPGAMAKEFAPVIPQALPVVLSGLSDEVETVREVALRAGQVLVSTHGKTHSDQLLPALEDGLFDDNWRIRQSSVQLLGDLLYLIGDTKEIALDEGLSEDDARGSTRAGEAIEEALGLERRNSILASLYLIRSDTSAVVRQSALQVWKTVVPNTPKALREILPLLIGQIVTALASGHEDKRTVAGRALGDIVKKLGDQVLPEVVPFLRRGLESGNENMRQGVCLGLAEIMECATSRQVEEFIDTLVPAIQDALCDPSPEVREQSAQAFHSLYKVVGLRSIEHVVPSLLTQLGQDGDTEGASSTRERAVFGLKEILQLRPRDLLPYLIPRLVAAPISVAHSRALGAVAEVTGGSIHAHLATIIPAVVAELARTDYTSVNEAGEKTLQEHEALMHAASTLMSSVQTIGMSWLCNEVTRPMSHKDAGHRKWSTWLVEQLLCGSKAEFEDRVPQLLKELLQRLVDTDRDVLTAAWAALKALNVRVPAEELVPHLTFARSIIVSIVSDARHRKGGGGGAGEYLLPGTNIPKGLEPLLPMYQQGLMHGTPAVREAAASGIGELVDVTSMKFLQPFLIKITGPLIRIVGDRFPPGVKAAILHTLGLLLGKGGASLKPFVPQLQTTFVKALGDSSRTVRNQSRIALGQLMGLTTRVDPLISDLASAASSAADVAVKATILEALTEVLETAGTKASSGAIEQVIAIITALQSEQDEAVKTAALQSLGFAKQLQEKLRA